MTHNRRWELPSSVKYFISDVNAFACPTKTQTKPNAWIRTEIPEKVLGIVEPGAGEPLRDLVHALGLVDDAASRLRAGGGGGTLNFLDYAVFVIRIRIRMLLGLPDPHQDPFVKSTDPAPDPSIIKQN